MKPLTDIIKELEALKSYPQEITLADGSRVFDLEKMIKSHQAFLQAQSGNPAYMPYYLRLAEVCDVLVKKAKNNESQNLQKPRVP